MIVDKEIYVSVAIITYGQESFIRQAIDSVLAQKTTFRYEIVIGEDCSPDDTRRILLEYQTRHPELITLILHDRNVGATQNNIAVYSACRGKYIASLEGDDYWIDRDKLEKQAVFLDRNVGYIGVSHRIEGRDLDDKVKGRYPESIDKDTDISMDDFSRGCFFSATATMFRNFFLSDASTFIGLYTADKMVGDLTFCIYLLAMGKVHVLYECMAVYRVRSGEGYLNYNSLRSAFQKNIDHITILNSNYAYYDGCYSFWGIYKMHLLPALSFCIRNKKMKDFWYIFWSIPFRVRFFFCLSIPFSVIRKIKSKNLVKA